jgi:putative spermidine/putrescine transport system permease protein
MTIDRLPPGRLALWVFCAGLLVFLIAPILVIVITSFNNSAYLEFPPRSLSLRWYTRFFTSAHWLEPAWLSLRIALITTTLATVLGTTAAIGIVRGRFRAKRSLELFFISPMVLPIVVLALGLYFMFSEYHMLNTSAALALGHTVIATPIVMVIVTAAARVSDPAMELAARSLGATYWRALWFVTIPSIRPALVAGAAFAFLISFDDVVIAIFLGGPDATTLPKRMWETIRFEIDPTLTAISSLLTLVAILILVSVELVRRSVQTADRT